MKYFVNWAIKFILNFSSAGRTCTC